MADSRVYAFGPFHYHAEQRLLLRQGEVGALAPKTIDTLHVLLERRLAHQWAHCLQPKLVRETHALAHGLLDRSQAVARLAANERRSR
jgi:hypothetical protein